jgi:hypothetical protein
VIGLSGQGRGSTEHHVEVALSSDVESKSGEHRQRTSTAVIHASRGDGR